jgi:hypothetical protein
MATPSWTHFDSEQTGSLHCQALILRGIVGFAAIFLTFALLKHRAALERISADVARATSKAHQ